MLAGIKVIEYATYVAAPSAGGMLADWGAEVIKIEPLEGDPIRRFFDTIGAESDGNPVFDLDNRGKRSIALDTSKPEGARLLIRLAETADVFLTNVRPGGLKRSGLDYEGLKAINPKLVYASVTGYGNTGPDADRPGFDMAAFWSRAGVGRLTTPKDQDIMPIRTAMGDHITGIATAAGILAALVERARTGQGRFIETSLLRTGIYAIGSDMAIQLKMGRVASNKDRAGAVNPINNFFKAACGTWICLLPRQGNADWGKLCAAIGQPGLAEDPRFASSKARRENRMPLMATLDAAFAAHPLDYWAKRLDAEDLVWAPVQSAAQVASDPQAIAAGAFVDLPGADGRPSYSSPASPVKFHGADDGPKGPSPSIGQHTDEVLTGLGLSVDEIARLHQAGLVKGG